MIFVHKQDDYQRVTHPTKVTLSKAKRVLANMDSELNSSHGGSTTVGPIASEVEYTLPTFGNSPIAWNSHGQRWELTGFSKYSISDAFSREVLPIFCQIPVWIHPHFRWILIWRANSKLLSLTNKPPHFDVSIPEVCFQVSTLNRSCLHQRSRSRSAQITHFWLAKESHKKPLELPLFDGNHHESSVLPHYHIINRLFTTTVSHYF